MTNEEIEKELQKYEEDLKYGFDPLGAFCNMAALRIMRLENMLKEIKEHIDRAMTKSHE